MLWACGVPLMAQGHAKRNPALTQEMRGRGRLWMADTVCKEGETACSVFFSLSTLFWGMTA